MSKAPKKAGKLVGEFKEFALRGNVIDLAVGVVIGGAFGKIVSSVVADILMPIVGLLFGGVDFSSWNIAVGPLWGSGEPVPINIGSFINTVVDFFLIALFIFLLVKGINALRRKEKEAPSAPAEPTKEEKLLQEIRDQLVLMNGKK